MTPQHDAGDPRTAMAQLVKEYETAFNTNDARAMNDLFADDCVFVNFGGRLVEGRDDLYKAQLAVFEPGGPLSTTSVQYRIEHVTALSTSIVAVHARQRGLGSDGRPVEQPDPLEAVLLVVADDRDGDWRIRLGQNTPVL